MRLTADDDAALGVAEGRSAIAVEAESDPRPEPQDGVLYFEDFALGDRWELPVFAFEAEEIIEFAERWDPQPYHVDLAAGAASTFGGLVASGMHTLVMLIRVAHDELMRRTAAAAGLGLDRLRFHAPVRPGQALHGAIEVLETSPPRAEGGWGRVVFGHSLVDDDGGDVLTVETRVLVWCRPPGLAQPVAAGTGS